MNRLSSWIVRRPGAGRVLAFAAAAAAPSPASFAAAAAMEPPEWLEDVRLFLTGWVGGLVFFGTLFG